MNDTIVTLTPDSEENGVELTRRKYDLVREAMLKALRSNPEMSLRELTRAVDRQLWGRFNASVPWYVKIIKRDLQARHMIEEIDHNQRRRLRLIE